MEKLEKANLIVPIAKIKTGKKPIIYYGRKARAYTPPVRGNSNHMKFDKAFTSKLGNLIQLINPDLPYRDVRTLIDVLEQKEVSSKWDEQAIWFDDNRSEIRESEIDVRKLYDFLRMLKLYDENLINVFRKIESHFGLS